MALAADWASPLDSGLVPWHGACSLWGKAGRGSPARRTWGMADMATIATRLPWLSADEGADRVDGAMRPLALHLLRRAALYALLAARLVLVVPRVLMEFGVLGEDA